MPRRLSCVLRSSAALVASILVLGGCEDVRLPMSVDIDREAFVAAYVDLRLAALQNPSAELTPSARDSILAAHGVTGEELLEFARVRGRDPEYMQDVWNEITARMDGEDPEAVVSDSAVSVDTR